jgi:predicted O-methyltransferase YrrM
MNMISQTSWLPQKLRNKFSPLKREINSLLDLFPSKLVERAENPYATHIPILIGLSRLLKVKRVLEFGCGEFSTLAFLDRAIFTDLESLISLENDFLWKEKINALVKDDSRAILELINGSMSKAASQADLSEIDLIFIDDSVSGEQRVETIRKLTSKLSNSRVAVIHDFEYKPYRQAVINVSHQFRFNALNPNTGVVWNQAPINKKHLRKLNELIKQYSSSVSLTDIERWAQIFEREL